LWRTQLADDPEEVEILEILMNGLSLLPFEMGE
jgi:hypothetical protein